MTTTLKPLSHVAPPVSAVNPFAARLIAFTIGTTRLSESITFYSEVMNYRLLDAGSSPFGATAFLRPDGLENGGIRLIEVPHDAKANRPRPETRAWDTGLAVMECRTSEPDQSFARLAAAGTPTLSEPMLYCFRDIAPIPDLDVRSYAAFGPGGEQIFVTANVRPDRPAWDFPDALHGPLAGAVIVGIDSAPVDTFYEQALGLVRTSAMVCAQESANALIGAPADTVFRWGFLAERVSIEVEAFERPDTVHRPTSLGRTGLAMMTIEVSDLAAVRERCRTYSIELLDQPALKIAASFREGFVIRGAAGELIEVVTKA